MPSGSKAANSLLEVLNLCVSFGNTQAVTNLCFSLNRGDTLAIVGESGSGKSLTALTIMGLLPHQADMTGEIKFWKDAQQTSPLDLKLTIHERHIRGGQVAMIFQEPMTALNPVVCVGQQIAEAILAHQQVSSKAARQQATEWLDKVHLPNPAQTFRKYPHELSGGQRQRVMIAMALCNKPSLIIADEPTTALDASVQEEIVALLQELQSATDAGLLFITHDLALASRIANKVLIMYRGQGVEYGPANVVFKHPQHPYTNALLASRPTPEQKGLRLNTVADFFASGEGDSRPAAAGKALEFQILENESPILSLRNIDVWYPTKFHWWGSPAQFIEAVCNVSFDLLPGEVVGLVGESGCGKSTISRAIMGLQPLTRGQILFEGEDISGLLGSSPRRVRKNLQLVFQDPMSALNPALTVRQTLAEVLQVHQIVPSEAIAEEVKRLMEIIRLPYSFAEKYPHECSGGQRQRIGIARALAVRPRLLICDECVSALDVSVQAEILNLLQAIRQEFKLSCLFISHDIGVVHYIADSVCVMKAGAIIESGPVETVFRNPARSYTKALIAASGFSI